MSPGALILRGLRHYWRTNLAVIAGVAIAVSVLAGALLVGESVRASLRGLVDERLGRTAIAVTGQGFFRQALGRRNQASRRFLRAVCRRRDPHCDRSLGDSRIERPRGLAHSGVRHRRVVLPPPRRERRRGRPPAGRRCSAQVWPPSSARRADDGLLLRVQKPSAIPADTLAGRRSDTSRAVRLTTRETLAPERMGEFTLRPQQEAVRAVFVPIARLQRDLELAGRANVLLLSARGDAAPMPRQRNGC